MQTVGLGLLLVGLVGLLGVGVYYALEALASDDIPLAIRLSIVAVVAGFLVLVVSVVRDRVRESRSERFEEVDR